MAYPRFAYPAPGRIIDGLHLHSTGSGPSVILEAGIASSSISWKPVQDLASQFARVISYDRAGLGWSDPPRTARSLDNLVAELRALLHAAAIPRPYLLVAHSFGGLIVRHYAALHPAEVSGLVLVDPVPIKDWFPLTPSQAARLARGVKLSRRGAWLARAGVVRLALALVMSGSRLLPMLIGRASAGNGASVANRLASEIRKLPPEVWPVIGSHWSAPKAFLAMAAYLQALPGNAASVQLPMGVRTIVLTPPNPACEIPPDAIHRIAQHSGHWIQLDEPGLVADAIRELMA